MNSLVLSVFAAQYLTEHHFVPAWLAYGAVSLWVIWIGLARLYMGLHTPIDVLGGFAAGLFLLWIWIGFVGAMCFLFIDVGFWAGELFLSQGHGKWEWMGRAEQMMHANAARATK